AGISIDALSDSSVIRLCSSSMVSFSATRTSMTSTSSTSPMSGTLISIGLLIVFSPDSGVMCIGFILINIVFLDGFCYLGHGDNTIICQGAQGCQYNKIAINLKVVA